VAKLKYLRKKVKQVKFLLYPKEELINFEDGVSPSAPQYISLVPYTT